MNKLTERNGQYYLDGNLASYDEVIVFLQEENEQLSEDINALENSIVHKYQPRIKELEQEREDLIPRGKS